MKSMKMIAMIGMLVAGFSATAQDRARMLHVSVQDTQNTQNNMSMNLPMGFLQSMAPMVQQHVNQAIEEGNVRDELAANGIDLEGMWQSIRDNGPMQLMEIVEDDTTITVRTTETHLVVNVVEGDNTNAHMEMPIQVLDALFVEGDEFNVERLVEALDGLESQDLFNLTSDEQTVRVWID